MVTERNPARTTVKPLDLQIQPLPAMQILQAARQRIVDDIARAVTVLKSAAGDVRKAAARAEAAKPAKARSKAKAKAKVKVKAKAAPKAKRKARKSARRART